MYDTRISRDIKQIKSILSEGKLREKWISMRKASTYTCLSQTTLNRAIRSGRLRASKQTGKTLFKVKWLDDFLLGESS